MMVVKRSMLPLAFAPLLGEGEFAKVFQVTLDGRAYAIKQANPSSVAKAALEKERAVLEACTHPNIIALKAVADDGRCLVLELCPGGTLEDRLQTTRGKRSKSRGKSRRQTMPARRIVQIALELMRAVQCMHEKGLCHGDVKSANILLATKVVTADTAGVRLADMGFSREIGSTVSSEDGGSAPFICRELQLGLDCVSRATHDIFACGVVMLDLACTRKPYEDLNVREFDIAVEEGTLYSRGTVPLAEFKNKAAFEQFSSLFFEMLSHHPDKRPRASDVVERLEEIASALDGQRGISRGARPCKTDVDAMASEDGTYGGNTACMTAEINAFMSDSPRSSAPEAGLHSHWGQQQGHDVASVSMAGANPVITGRFCDAAGGVADRFPHVYPAECLAVAHFPMFTARIPQQQAQTCVDEASLHKDLMWCYGDCVSSEEGAHLISDGIDCQMQIFPGGSALAREGRHLYSGDHDGHLPGGAAGMSAADGLWGRDGGAHPCTAFARFPLGSHSSPHTSLPKNEIYGVHCLEPWQATEQGGGEYLTACRGVSMWSARAGESQCSSPSGLSSRDMCAGGAACALHIGGALCESQSAVQPGWAPSHLEELSPRNAISEALAVSPYKLQATDRQVAVVSPKKGYDAHGEIGLDWSPW